MRRLHPFDHGLVEVSTYSHVDGLIFLGDGTECFRASVSYHATFHPHTFVHYYNSCYTGLEEKMIAYEDDVVEITWLSTHTTTSEMRFFAVFRQYIFFPWIAAICIIFIMTEIRHRRTVGSKHLRRVAAVRRGSLSLWGSVADGKGLQEMTINNFLQLTRQGSPLAIVDGLVIDIGKHFTSISTNR